MLNPPAARAPDLSGLADLARDPRLDLKPVILRVQTDLFAAAPSRDRAMLETFAALAGGLAPIVDEDTAAIVARKLAPIPDAPESVLVLLARRGGAARAAVIAGTPALTPALREAVADVDPDALAPALAARADLAPAALREFAARDRAEIDLALAVNPAAILPATVVAMLVARARRRADAGDPALAAALLARRELAGAELAALYVHADEADRARIRTGVAAHAALRGLARGEVRGADLGRRLVEACAAGDRGGFARLLGEALGVAPEALRLGEEARGAAWTDLLALALRACGLGDEEAVFVLITLEPEIGRSVDAVFRLARLLRETARGTALDLVRAILGGDAAPARPSALHQPYAAPSAKPSAGSPRAPGLDAPATERARTPERAARRSS